MTLYKLPIIDWTPTIDSIRNKIQHAHGGTIDYGLVHYYHDDQSNIAWHSDREALRSPIYSISVGHPRRFCLRHKITKETHTYDLFDGDLLIMKVGCQDRYEHCIKSIKEFNKPRISITFRQLESPLCSFTLTKNGVGVDSSGQIITNLRKGIQIRHDGEASTPFVIPPHEEIVPSANILQSNLQKAIRRQEKEVAMATAAYMLRLGYHMNLLRRLTIITLEDVCMNRYYPQIVWYFVAIQYGYRLSMYDVTFIHSYSGWLCEVTQYHTYSQYKTYRSSCTISDVQHDIYALSILIRIEYGGFSSEKGMMYGLLDEYRNGTLYLSMDSMKMVPYDDESVPWIMDCAIDFHCFPHMPEKVAVRLKKMGVEISEEEVRDMIWTFDSMINKRHPMTIDHELRELWDNYVLPACTGYRTFIREAML